MLHQTWTHQQKNRCKFINPRKPNDWNPIIGGLIDVSPFPGVVLQVPAVRFWGFLKPPSPNNQKNIDVSENSGTPKSSILNHFNRVFHYFHHPFWGTPIFGNTHMQAFSLNPVSGFEMRNCPATKPWVCWQVVVTLASLGKYLQITRYLNLKNLIMFTASNKKWWSITIYNYYRVYQIILPESIHKSSTWMSHEVCKRLVRAPSKWVIPQIYPIYK